MPNISHIMLKFINVCDNAWNKVAIMVLTNLKIYYCGLIGLESGKTKCPTTPYKAGRVVTLTCQYDHDFQGVRIIKSINYKVRIKILHNKCILFQNVVLFNVKNMIFYTWNVVSRLYHACIMSCIGFKNGITNVNKEDIPRPFHSWFISMILDSWYITSICMGPLMLMVHDGMVTCKNGATYFSNSQNY